MVLVRICELLVHVEGLLFYLVVFVLCGFVVGAHFAEELAEVVKLLEMELVEPRNQRVVVLSQRVQQEHSLARQHLHTTQKLVSLPHEHIFDPPPQSGSYVLKLVFAVVEMEISRQSIFELDFDIADILFVECVLEVVDDDVVEAV